MPKLEDWIEPETKSTRYFRYAWRGFGCVLSVYLCLWFGYHILKNDSRTSRAATAKRCQELKKRIQANPQDEEAFQELVSITKYWSSFNRCYALGTIGELGPVGAKAMPIFQNALRNGNGFERQAASRALSNLGPLSRPALDDLLYVIVKHSNEISTLYAAEAIEKIGDTSPKVIETLTTAINQPEFFERERIRKIRDRLHELSNSGQDE